MSVLGYDHGAKMRARWGADAARAWLPLCSASSPVLKILRKGAPDFPASVRYISAQMRRACSGGCGESSELLRDIVRTWAIGSFRGPLPGSAVERVRSASRMKSDALYEAVAANARSVHLHLLIQNFVAGVTTEYAHIAWAMHRTVAFPFVEAVWAMLNKVVGKRTRSKFAAFPKGFASEIFDTPLVSAKRIKTLYTALPEAERRGVDFFVWSRRAAACQRTRALPMSDAQMSIPDLTLPYCKDCLGPTSTRINLRRLESVCDICGGSRIVPQGLRGIVICQPATPLTRLCSHCGVIGGTNYQGVVGLCASCAQQKRMPCVVCGRESERHGIAGYTTVYGMCREHAVPVHYSSSMVDVAMVLRSRCI